MTKFIFVLLILSIDILIADPIQTYPGKYKLINVTMPPDASHYTICWENLNVSLSSDRWVNFFSLGNDWFYSTNISLNNRHCTSDRDFFGTRRLYCDVTTLDEKGYYTKKSCFKRGIFSGESCNPKERNITFKKESNILHLNGVFYLDNNEEKKRIFDCVYKKAD